MPHSPREGLDAKQSQALEKAAMKIIEARNEARQMLADAGVFLPSPGGPDIINSTCGATIPGFGRCGCSGYTGDGGECTTPIDLGSGITPGNFCRHLPSEHIFA